MTILPETGFIVLWYYQNMKIYFTLAWDCKLQYIIISLHAKRCIRQHDLFLYLFQPKRIKKITMLPVKRGRGRPPKFNSAPNSPKPSSPIPNGYAENGKHKKFKYKRFVTADSPVDEVKNSLFYVILFTQLLTM